MKPTPQQTDPARYRHVMQRTASILQRTDGSSDCRETQEARERFRDAVARSSTFTDARRFAALERALEHFERAAERASRFAII